jgi:hypothetical protein
MDKFWVDEVRRVSRALSRRRLDPEDIDRWRRFRESLEQNITEWEVCSSHCHLSIITKVYRLDLRMVSATRSLYVPIPNLLCAFSAFDFCVFVDPVQVHGPSPIVSSLSCAFSVAKRALRSVRLSPSAALEFVKPVHHSLMLKAESKLEENCGSCLEFLRECVRYGEKVVMICISFTSYSSFWRTRASQDLGDQAARLRDERVEVVAYTPIRTRGAFLHDFCCHFGRCKPLRYAKVQLYP